MTRTSSNDISVHGVFMDIYDVGVLIIGQSGMGKSELALGLVNHGHKLIADDITHFDLNADGNIIGSCPAVLQDFLEVRGIGLLNIRAMFGESSITVNKKLELITQIKAQQNIKTNEMDRLQGMQREHKILGIGVPEVTIPVAPGRNLAILVETAVRNFSLRVGGYRANEVFISRHDEYLVEQQRADKDDREFLDDN